MIPDEQVRVEWIGSMLSRGIPIHFRSYDFAAYWAALVVAYQLGHWLDRGSYVLGRAIDIATKLFGECIDATPHHKFQRQWAFRDLPAFEGLAE